MRETLQYRVEQTAASLAYENVTLAEAEGIFRDALIDAALTLTDGNQTQCARRLGIHRNTLLTELRKRRGRA
jgi:DNA-binding protein Fis